jgi:hypothetical protein
LKTPLLLLALLLALGGGYLVTDRLLHSALPPPAVGPEAKIDWLAREFSLSPAARTEIERLQLAYAPVCEGHCAAIAAAETALAAARAASDPAAHTAAEAELERLKRVCAEATRAHLEAVAAHMPPPQAARFLALMEPRIAHHGPRTGAPALAPTAAPAAGASP